MSISTALAIYFLIWWVTLFAILPFGVRPQLDDKEAGTDPGAPVAARILPKLLWTTLVSAVIFAVCAWLYIYRLVTLTDLIRWMGLPS